MGNPRRARNRAIVAQKDTYIYILICTYIYNVYSVHSIYSVNYTHMYIVWAIQVGQEIGQLRRKRIEIEEAKEIAFPSATKTLSKGRPHLKLKKKQWTLIFYPQN